MLAIATLTRKSFNSKFVAKLIFQSDFYVTIINADVGSLKLLNTLFDKYLDHMLVKFEKKNRFVRNIQNFVLFGKKWLTIFEKGLTPFGIRSCNINNYSMLKY